MSWNGVSSGCFESTSAQIPLMCGVAKLFPDSAYQLTHNALFPKNCMHIENLGGQITAKEIQNERLILGCFPWKFRGGEAAFCRAVAFLGDSWKP